MRFFLTILTAWVLLYSSVSSAMSLSDRNIDDIYSSSSLVMEAVVTKLSAQCDGEGVEGCLAQYELVIEPRKIIKGVPEVGTKSAVSVCSRISLDIGGRYFLFLEPPSENSLMEKRGCSLALEFDGAFEKLGKFTYRVKSPDATILVDFLGEKYMTNAIVSKQFDECLDRISRGLPPEGKECRSQASQND
ncbi:hypothetical protein [Pseudoxanthomonas sacheonensis]|uniref:Secreted protein n=1 Tax=Pseudoxanthomonas sacheonensis TaxID=443615 RepID=A0ABU1RPA1_9GAMM|nr:hypothetical protein [Pseudoxanthomonas sacheonensis]MDR6840432.1 hypothetical protein [Pseudoxanthomonas sacheonensis]